MIFTFLFSAGAFSQETTDDDILHQRLEFIFASYSHEEPYVKETIGLKGFSTFNLKMSLFPVNRLPLGLRLGFSFREINRTRRMPVYQLPENDLGIEEVQFHNYNMLSRSYLQLVYAPLIGSWKINPYLSAGIASGRISSGFNLQENKDFDYWHENFDGIRSRSRAFRGELGISTLSEDKFFRFYIGVTWFRTFQPVQYFNVAERQACTAYTNGNILCPEFDNAETFSVISSEVPFYVSFPKYESIINLIGFQISIAFCVPNNN